MKHEDGPSSAHLEPVTVFAAGDPGLLAMAEDAEDARLLLVDLRE